jgi:CheY-like chemotaxis protein
MAVATSDLQLAVPSAGMSQASTVKPPVPAILIVDDNAAKRLAIRAMLAPLAIRLVEVDSGRDALRAIVRQTFAMVLMDVRMPTLNGYETARLIRQRAQSEFTPIMFVTAFGSDEIETENAYAGGAVDFIFTPIRPEVLPRSRRSSGCSFSPPNCSVRLMRLRRSMPRWQGAKRVPRLCFRTWPTES